MKVLIVAHPDDEVIWFNPLGFDKIVFVFMNRKDKPEMLDKRAAVILSHPLRNKIVCLGLDETGIKSTKQVGLDRFLDDIYDVKSVLKEVIKGATEIYTHNELGEYGHYEHILIHQAVWNLTRDTDIKIYCPTVWSKGIKPELIVKNNIEFCKGVKALYMREGAWTWHKDFVPEKTLYFNKITN